MSFIQTFSLVLIKYLLVNRSFQLEFSHFNFQNEKRSSFWQDLLENLTEYFCKVLQNLEICGSEHAFVTISARFDFPHKICNKLTITRTFQVLRIVQDRLKFFKLQFTFLSRNPI